MVVLLRCRLQYSLFRPILPSLHRPPGALGSNPLSGQAGGDTTQKLSPFTGKVSRCSRDERGAALSCQAILLFPLSFAYAQQLPRTRWRLLMCDTMCQNIRGNAQFGTTALCLSCSVSLHRPQDALNSAMSPANL